MDEHSVPLNDPHDRFFKEAFSPLEYALPTLQEAIICLTDTAKLRQLGTTTRKNEKTFPVPAFKAAALRAFRQLR